MAEIEQNLVNIHGVYPGVDMDSVRQYPRIPADATQIVKYASATNGSSTVYTVTAGKTLYLCTAICNAQNLGAAGGRIFFYIRTGGAVTWFSLFEGIFLQNTGENWSASFVPALEVPASYDFYLTSSLANCTGYGSIFGYEI